ncbi:uncharacterized protein LOC128264346 [Drosophila gunungcola]|uniref:uncharacterized protein LOC128264346 n=1 Tax=Drosophila gunungcola TaxID=103775 RepID=UPI0022DFA136|nr:uncharacterized protein LOC128264346 [Drosophila gunungcola]
MTSPIFCLSLSLLLLGITTAWPQDLGTGVMLVVGQMQQLMENGGGLKNEQSIELLGEKVSGGLKLGFGEVMEMPLGRRRRSNAARN